MGGVHEFCFDFFDVVWDFFYQGRFLLWLLFLLFCRSAEVEVLFLPFFSFDYSHQIIYHYKFYKYFILIKNVMVKI
jgi:hypothetical protein